MNKDNAREERKDLDKLIQRAKKMGLRIKFTNPMGFLMHRYPARNHKKMILIDEDVSYVGGMNFTEHNFLWSDMMVRQENPDINAALNVSFMADLNETEPEPIIDVNDDVTLYTLNGWKTKAVFGDLINRIKSSNKVIAISPYISYPMLDAIASVEDNTVILPKNNNKPIIQFLHGLERYSEINFKYVPGKMLHAKLLILDDQTAVYGSSNFDLISYFFEKEVVLVHKNENLIKQLSTFTSELINK
jgi:cardiolipin synthase